MNTATESIPVAPGATNDAPSPTEKAGGQLPQIQQTHAVGERLGQAQTFEITQQQKE